MIHGGTFHFVRYCASVLAAAILVAGCSDSGDSSDTTDPGTPSDTAASSPPDADVVLSVDDEVVATLDPAYQSYNVEMVEVTGGQFWQPYDAGSGKVVRPPIDLSSARLRNLAKELGPAYVRVSGTWANWTYFDVDGTSGGTPPENFDGVLTTEQWKGVGEFADAVDAQIVTSFASTPGVRDADGVWLDDQARALLEFSKANDIPVVAAEFFNEPGLPIGVPANYDAQDFNRDFTTFKTMVDEVMPELTIVGPGATEVIEPAIASADLMDPDASRYDRVSYHFYPKLSERCGSTEGPEIALTQEFLSRIDEDKAFFEQLRDTYEPGAPMWITEVAQAACGGDRWAAQYLDVIRYIDNLGRLATGDGDVVFHNTLAASDYGLIDEDGMEPRPNYWAAVLWQRLMGPKVLEVGSGGEVDDLAVYAQCTPDDEPGVTYAVVNSSASEERTVTTSTGAAEVYLLTSDALDSPTIALNGTVLEAAEDGTLPKLAPVDANGAVTVPAASVAFVVDRDGNAAAGCG